MTALCNCLQKLHSIHLHCLKLILQHAEGQVCIWRKCLLSLRYLFFSLKTYFQDVENKCNNFSRRNPRDLLCFEEGPKFAAFLKLWALTILRLMPFILRTNFRMSSKSLGLIPAQGGGDILYTNFTNP